MVQNTYIKLENQRAIVEQSKVAMQQSMKQQEFGTLPNKKLYLEIDNEDWLKYNAEYLKLRKMEFKAL